MKQSLLLCSILFLFYLSRAQAPTPSWGAQYNGPSGGTDNGRQIVMNKKNNTVYVTGISESKRNNGDITTISYDAATGRQNWVQRYNGTGNANDYPYSITISDSDYVYVAGRSMATNGNYDYVVVKYDSLGNQKWAARYDGPNHLNDEANDVKVDASGNVYVTGGTEGLFVISTIKYDAGGNLKWVVNYDNLPTPTTDPALGKEEGNSLALDGAGNIYLTGVSGDMLLIKYNDLVDANGIQYVTRAWVRTVVGGSEGRKILFDGTSVIATGWGGITVKYNSLGELVWTAPRPTATAAFWDMILDAGGNAYITGTTGAVNGKEDFATAKIIGSTGGLEWISTFDGSFHDIEIGRSIALDALGNVFITGRSVINDGTRNGQVVFAILKYNNAGVQQWSTYYNPGNRSSDGFGVVTDNSGNLYGIGQMTTKTATDYVVVKYPAQPAPANRIAKQTLNTNYFYFNTYPNPATEIVAIELRLPVYQNIRLSIIDIMGKEIAVLANENKQPGIYKMKYYTARTAAGTYFLRLQHGKIVETKRLVIIK